MYPTFVYPVPELLPALVVLITMAPKKSQSIDDDDDDGYEDGYEERIDNTGCCCGLCCMTRKRRWMSNPMEVSNSSERASIANGAL